MRRAPDKDVLTQPARALTVTIHEENDGLLSRHDCRAVAVGAVLSPTARGGETEAKLCGNEFARRILRRSWTQRRDLGGLTFPRISEPEANLAVPSLLAWLVRVLTVPGACGVWVPREPEQGAH